MILFTSRPKKTNLKLCNEVTYIYRCCILDFYDISVDTNSQVPRARVPHSIRVSFTDSLLVITFQLFWEFLFVFEKGKKREKKHNTACYRDVRYRLNFKKIYTIKFIKIRFFLRYKDNTFSLSLHLRTCELATA